MDQGVAAVMAGLAETVGALSGAVAGLRGGRPGALKAVGAARAQVQDKRGRIEEGPGGAGTTSSLLLRIARLRTFR